MMGTHFHQEGEPCTGDCPDLDKMAKRLADVFEIPEAAIGIGGDYAEIERRALRQHVWLSEAQKEFEQMVKSGECPVHGQDRRTDDSCMHCAFLSEMT
jgi:hypothetical protein